jgi:single-stranded DNA-binding protein
VSGIEVAFFGTLARDAEAKVSSKGKPYARLNVRVGETEAQYINVTCFDPQAIEQADKLIRGAKLYVEGGGLKIDEWTGQDGVKRHGLSCMSWHARLSEIGRNRPKRERKPADDKPSSAPAMRNDFHNDEIPFAPEWR